MWEEEGMMYVLLLGAELASGLPDAALTPGAGDPRVMQANIDATICVKGYAKSVRPPARFTSALKHRQLARVGLADQMRAFEEDHLIPLELGGAPADQRNLWPEKRQPPWGAGTKDRLENRLHRLVCAHALSLRDAQRAIARDWIAAYRRYYER